MALTNLDLQQARIKQVLFKSRLRSVLYGVREADAALFSPRENPLGQWFDSTIRPHYGGTPAAAALERALQRLLDAGQALVAQYRRGQIEEARAGLEQVDAHAQHFDELLLALEHDSRAA